MVSNEYENFTINIKIESNEKEKAKSSIIMKLKSSKHLPITGRDIGNILMSVNKYNVYNISIVDILILTSIIHCYI